MKFPAVPNHGRVTTCLVVHEYDADNKLVREYTAYGTAENWEQLAAPIEVFSLSVNNVDTHKSGGTV